MSNFKVLQQDLKNKERYISDLIRFVQTRTDNNPNYSLMLGAGCSVTSGINSANTLIKEWKKEIFIQLNNDDLENSEAKVEEFLNSQLWYDSRNPYSSLFEKRYDLPRQRRMFVEQEVRDKTPSIGYSYLIKLVEGNFFKTIFTTNFDDLINEAFYQYSNKRPILCAHDSAISSITVTSKRPKVIKLHGDYLFDDIKSTLRETESLEENIKNKFIEFAKDYGLIIIGYGGCDRSIIDILTYLLKNEEYFKHGIYWCLREDSEINEDLRKLLWKDRVYYVKIDGFDELMAELNYSLNDGVLPIDSNYLNEKKSNIIGKLLDNKFLKDSKSEIVKNDLARLSNNHGKEIIENFFQFLKSNDKVKLDENRSSFKKKGTSSKFLSKENARIQLDLDQAIMTDSWEDALKLIDSEIYKIDTTTPFYYNLLESKGKCLRKLNRIIEAIDVLKELLRLDNKEIPNYVKLSKLIENENEKIEILDQAINQDSFYDILYYEKAKIMLDWRSQSLNKSTLSFTINDIEKVIDKGIEVFPGISNPNWRLKFSTIEEINDDEQKTKEAYKELISKLEKQEKYHPIVVEANLELYKLSNTPKQKIYQYLAESIDRTIGGNFLKHNEFLLLDTYAENIEREKLKIRLDYIESTFELNDEYLFKRSKYELEIFDQLDKALKTLDEIEVKKEEVYQRIFRYSIFNKDLEKAERICNDFLSHDEIWFVHLLEAKEDYPKAIEIMEELLEKFPNNYNYVINYSHILLRDKKFQDAYNYLNDKLQSTGFKDPYLLINYYIAYSNYKKGDIKEKITEKILRNKNISIEVEVAAHALLRNEKKVSSLLKTIFKKDSSEKYSMRSWAVFQDYIKTDQFKTLFCVN